MYPKILAIIPARGGSKGVKRKNVRQVKGIPLIGWTINEAKKSRFIEKIVVSTEDKEISGVSESFGAQVIRRPEMLARDDSPSIDAIFHVLDTLKGKGYVPEHVILLQPTSPLRIATQIDEALSKFIENSGLYDSLISVTEQEHPPAWMRTIDERGYLRDFMAYNKDSQIRRQDFQKVYRLNGAIYIIKTEKLYQNRGFETDRTLPYIMDDCSSMDIDTELDLEIAEFLLGRYTDI